MQLKFIHFRPSVLSCSFVLLFNNIWIIDLSQYHHRLVFSPKKLKNKLKKVEIEGTVFLRRTCISICFLFLPIRICCSEYSLHIAYFEVYTWRSHGIHQHQIWLNTVSIRVQSGEILIKQHKLFLGLRVWTWDLPCKCCYILKESYQWCTGGLPPTDVSLSKPICNYSWFQELMLTCTQFQIYNPPLMAVYIFVHFEQALRWRQ